MPLLWDETWGDYWEGDRLNSNALITENDLMSSMKLNRNSLLIPFFEIYNSSSDATAATVTKVGNILTLTVTGGLNASENKITVINADYNTMTKVVNAITHLNRGWVCNLICVGDQLAVNLYNCSISCLASTNNTTLNGFDGLMLDELINAASASIEKICNRTFISTSYTQYYDGSDTLYLRLKQYPVTTFTSLKLYDYQDSEVLETFTEHTEYEVYLDEGIIYKPGGFSPGIKNYQVVYTAGYATIPSDIKQACKMLCQSLYTKANSTGIKSESIGDYSYTLADTSGDRIMGVAVPPEVMSLLAPYIKYDSDSIGK